MARKSKTEIENQEREQTMAQTAKQENTRAMPTTPTVRIESSPIGHPSRGTFQMSIKIDGLPASSVIVHTSPKKFAFQKR
jgi:hypothetical protein